MVERQSPLRRKIRVIGFFSNHYCMTVKTSEAADIILSFSTGQAVRVCLHSGLKGVQDPVGRYHI